MGDLSKHFSRHEFGGKPVAELVSRLELLRRMVGGKPLRIISGIRTAAENQAVGGVRRSQHIARRAADIPSGYATPAQAAQAGFRGIGISQNGKWAIHVDVRTGPRAAWRYKPDGSFDPAPFP